MDATQNETSNRKSILFCRACLSTSNNLLNMCKYNLTEAFSSILDTPILHATSPYLCTYCCTLLQKCVAFRDMCVRTQRTLVAELVNGELKIDCIHKLNNISHQFYNLSITQLDNIDSTLPARDIKVEPNIDFVNIDNIKNTELKEELDNNTENSNINKDTLIKETKDVKKRRKNNKKTKRDIEIDFDNCETDVSEDNHEIEKRKVTKRQTVVKEKVRSAEVNNIKEVKRKSKRKKEVKTDFSDIENTYMVRIVNLSKEEQLEEIASRKKSRNYLESRFRCEQCGKGYDAEAAYTHHLLRHSADSGALACEICSLRFKVKCRLMKHQESHQLKFVCSIDGCHFVSRDRAHAKNHHAMHAGKTYECQHCGKTFSKSTTHLTHVRLTHPAMNVACDVCGETFVSQKGCRLHKNRMHAQNKKLEQHKCPTCSSTFYSVEALSRHLESAGEHVDLRPCEQCGQNCASEEELHRHVEEKHPKETYRCDECDMTFSRAAAFDLHHRRKHLGQRFSAAGRLAPRRAPGHFVCEQCGRVLTSRQGLRYHLRDHKGLNLKLFTCPECNKTFAAKHMRDWHMRSHTGEKPYQCPDCPLAFSLNSNFKRHHKAVHLGQRKSIPCNICGRVFTTTSCVRVHVNAVHRGMPWPKRRRPGKPERAADDNK